LGGGVCFFCFFFFVWWLYSEDRKPCLSFCPISLTSGWAGVLWKIYNRYPSFLGVVETSQNNTLFYPPPIGYSLTLKKTLPPLPISKGYLFIYIGLVVVGGVVLAWLLFTMRVFASPFFVLFSSSTHPTSLPRRPQERSDIK